MNWKDSLKFKGSHDYRDSLYVEPASRDQMFIFFNYFIAWVFMSPVCLRPHTGGPEASLGTANIFLLVGSKYGWP